MADSVEHFHIQKASIFAIQKVVIRPVEADGDNSRSEAVKVTGGHILKQSASATLSLSYPLSPSESGRKRGNVEYHHRIGLRLTNIPQVGIARAEHVSFRYDT